MATIIDLCADGGHDETTLVAAWNSIKDEADWGDGYVFRIWPASGSLGNATFGATTHTPIESSRLQITGAMAYPPKNGVWQAQDEVATLTSRITNRVPWLRIGPVAGVGGPLQWGGSSTHGFETEMSTFAGLDGDRFEVDSVHFRIVDPDNQSGIGGYIWQDGDTQGNTEFTIKNSIFEVLGNLDSFSQNNAILSCGAVPGSTGTFSMTFTIYNNLLRTDCAANGSGYKIHQALKVFGAVTSTTTLAGSVKSNILISTGAAYDDAYTEGANGVYTISGDNNATNNNDTTPTTLLGGTSNITTLVPGDEFVDIDNDVYTLKEQAQLRRAGSSELSKDMYQRSRHLWDVGPIENPNINEARRSAVLGV